MIITGEATEILVNPVHGSPELIAVTFSGDGPPAPFSVTFHMDVFRAVQIVGELARAVETAVREPETQAWMYANKSEFGPDMTDEDMTDNITLILS